MRRHYHFADPRWFRISLKVLLVTTSVFAVLSLYPAFGQGTPSDQQRAILGLVGVCAFVAIGCVFSVAMRDGYLCVDTDALEIRFEAFFSLRIPVESIVRASPIDPKRRWRHRFGLSTNFRDRITCSHGGPMIEIELAEPMPVRLGARTVALRRLWLGIVERDELVSALGHPRECRVEPDRWAA